MAAGAALFASSALAVDPIVIKVCLEMLSLDNA